MQSLRSTASLLRVAIQQSVIIAGCGAINARACMCVEQIGYSPRRAEGFLGGEIVYLVSLEAFAVTSVNEKNPLRLARNHHTMAKGTNSLTN